MSKITVRKIRYDNVDMEGALRLAENALRSDSMHTVVTPNLVTRTYTKNGIVRIIDLKNFQMQKSRV